MSITLITPDGTEVTTEVRPDNRTFSLPWLHPYERMNGQWQVKEIGYTFEIKLLYGEDKDETELAEICEAAVTASIFVLLNQETGAMYVGEKNGEHWTAIEPRRPGNNCNRNRCSRAQGTYHKQWRAGTMTLTFTRLDKPNNEAVACAYVAHDGDGKRQALILCWADWMTSHTHCRWSAYSDAICDLDDARFEEIAAFALARLGNGLELDGATVEV
jgi:hypothetical protein